MKPVQKLRFSVGGRFYLLSLLLLGLMTSCEDSAGEEDDPILVSHYVTREDGQTEVIRNYIHRNGHTALKTDFDYSGPFQNGMAYVCQGSSRSTNDNRPDYIRLLDDPKRKCGLMDRKGALLFPLRGDLQAAYFQRGLVLAMAREKWGLLNRHGKTILDFEYDALFVDANFIRFRQDGYYGLMDLQGKIILEAKYVTLSPFFEGFALFTNEDGQVGYVENGKETIVHKEVHSVLQGTMNEGLQRFTKIEIPPVVEGHFRHHHGLKDLLPIYSTYTMGKVGFIDSRGRLQIEQRFEKAGDFHEGLAAVVVDGKLGFIDSSGELAIEAKFPLGELWNAEFSEGLAPVPGASGYFTYIDKSGDAKIRFVQLGSQDWVRGPLYMLDRVDSDRATSWGEKHGYFRIDHYARPFRNGLAEIRVTKEPYGPRFLGLMNREGKLVYVSRSHQITDKDIRLFPGPYTAERVPESFR